MQKNIKFMQKFKLKICGIRHVHEAAYCEEIGVNYIGLNFVPSSKRVINVETGKNICGAVNNVGCVGVFMNQELEEVNRIAEEVGLDFIQLSGDEDLEYVAGCCRPVIKGISVGVGFDLDEAKRLSEVCEFLIFDGVSPGSGEVFDWGLVREFEGKFLVAGGVNEDNLAEILERVGPMGVDVASGIETNGQVDLGKINSLIEEIKNYE